MNRKIFLLITISLLIKSLHGQQVYAPHHLVWDISFHTGVIVRNSPSVPPNHTPFLIEINPEVQTDGSDDWQQVFGFPRVGCNIIIGDLGNKKELGTLFGLAPNITFITSTNHWYAPAIKLGLGVAYFNKPYDELENPRNFYIGSHITALGQFSLQLEPKINRNTHLLTGLRVTHCSNSHYQVPNLGMNLVSFYVGLQIRSSSIPENYESRKLDIPVSRLHLNIRSGLGVHELARTLGPAGTAKYAVYVNDIYLSRLFGKVSNVHAGLEVNYYNSYYHYSVNNNFFADDQKLKSTVITAFLAHELMIKHFSLVAQGGINVYNKFYNSYIKQYKSEGGLSLELKKLISTRLGLQYYLFDPKYCTRSNVFIGAYIKANFGQADFVCMQLGVVI